MTKNKISINEKFIPSYPQPSNRDESYIFLMLALGTAKRFLTSLTTLNNLSEKEEDAMLDCGEKVIEGSKTSDAYVKEFEKILTKYSKNEKLTDLGRMQIKQRIDLSAGTKVKSLPLDKETRKQLGQK